MRFRFPLSSVAPPVGAIVVALSVVPAAQAGAPSRRMPTFSSTVDVVNLNVAVTDDKDQNVSGLAPDDFRVYEDGVPQQLCMFTEEQLPISLAVLVDSSLSMNTNLPAVKAAALRLLRTLRPEDSAKIVQFNHRFSVLQDFTSDLMLLDNAVNSIHADGATGVYNAIYLALKDRQFRPAPNELKRQAIVVLSDGEDTSSLITDDQVIELAKKSNVSVFAISLLPPRAAGQDTQGADRANYFLTAVARETGGRSYFPSTLNQLDGVYDRIAEDLRTQYALGYVSNNPTRDGAWRKIAIATARGNLLLRHKLGYYAGALRRALTGGPTPAVASTGPQ
jgi:VWFA-related protein